ncbi:MAG: hypothetical protein GXO48_09720 [Chlorobi bacterium]|nr:hypothetical protein [Chlorobiota bacterium]
MGKKVFSSLNQLVSVLTPVEREFLLRRTCLLPDEFKVPAKALLSNQDVFIPSEYLQKRFLRYMLEWIVDELATFGNSLRYKLLGRWKVMSILKWRNSQVERVLKPILHMDK